MPRSWNASNVSSISTARRAIRLQQIPGSLSLVSRFNGLSLLFLLECSAATRAGTDAHSFVDRQHVDLAVVDAAGAGGVDGRVHRGHWLGIFDDDLELHLGEEIDPRPTASAELPRW